MWRRVFGGPLILLVTAVMVALVLPLLLLPRGGDRTIWVARHIWGPALLAIAGIRLVVTGHLPPAGGAPYIVLSSHQSHLDIPVLFSLLPLDLRMVGKRELFRIPLFGWYLSLAGFVCVDRKDRAQAVASLDAAARKVRGGTSVVVFPEGTRAEGDALLPFKKGPFHLITAAGVPVVRVVISGTRHVLPKRSLGLRAGVVRVHVAPPLDVTPWGPERREALMMHLHHEMTELKAQVDAAVNVA
jgi:1-acyl-sn-glycerol-3-phosphate acyltransferase